jgi:predicted nuclease with TOPRIM domain
MKNQDEQIVIVLTTIMTRLDELEFAQSQHKEMFYKVKKRLLELNDNLNDILDVVEGEDIEMIDTVKIKYSKLRNIIDNELCGDDYDDDDIKQLMNQIIGES